MKIRNVTKEDLQKALKETNKRFGGNICFAKINKINNSTYIVRLTVKDSKNKGARLSVPSFLGENCGRQRRMKAACWHVHGYFFDELLDVNQQAVIRVLGKRIYVSDGIVIHNWDDYNIGSSFYPFYASQACECERCTLEHI
jgi:hypothetical protein